MYICRTLFCKCKLTLLTRNIAHAEFKCGRNIKKNTAWSRFKKKKKYIYIYISGSMAMNTCAAEHYEASFQSCMLVRKTNQRLHVPVLLQLQLLNHTAVVGILV